MSVTLLIRNGLVIDPAQGIQKVASVAFEGSRCAGVFECGAEPTAAQEIDAEGCIVTPGLIDSHVHLFQPGTENSVAPDVTLLPMGVTSGIDQGSAGSGNFTGFYDSVIARSQTRVFAALNISSVGLITTRFPENLDPRFIDRDAMRRLFERYADVLCGIKVRISRNLVGDLGLEPLRAAAETAAGLGTHISVHTTNPPEEIPAVLAHFRQGDVYSHTYQGQGNCIVSPEGRLYPEVAQARARGVLFDTADARVHYCYSVIRQAFAEGFFPDTISTDLVQGSLFQPGVFGLPRVMGKYLALGMPLFEVIRAVTATPAQKILNRPDLGTLRPGALADAAIFRLKDVDTVMTDRGGESLRLRSLPVPQCTVLNGKVVFRQFDF